MYEINNNDSNFIIFLKTELIKTYQNVIHFY